MEAVVEKGAPIAIYPKGWGYEKWIVNKDEYCGKLLHIIKGKKCSWHYHKLKDETFYLQEGKILLKYSDEDNIEESKELILERGDKFHVYRGCLLYTSPSPRDGLLSRMPSSA